jgi:hypothetical protein
MTTPCITALLAELSALGYRVDEIAAALGESLMLHTHDSEQYEIPGVNKMNTKLETTNLTDDEMTLLAMVFTSTHLDLSSAGDRRLWLHGPALVASVQDAMLIEYEGVDTGLSIDLDALVMKLKAMSPGEREVLIAAIQHGFTTDDSN